MTVRRRQNDGWHCCRRPDRQILFCTSFDFCVLKSALFGYDFVLLIPTGLVFSPSDKTNGIENVVFLTMIPLYDDERDWLVENNSAVYLFLLNSKFGEDIFKVDFKREHYIPSEEELAFLREENNLAD